MSVDEQLRFKKDQYKKSIPTSFTTKDKQQIYKAISQETYSRGKSSRRRLFKPVSLITFAATLIIGLLTWSQFDEINENNLNQAISGNHSTHTGVSSSYKDNLFSEENSSGGGSGSTNESDSIVHVSQTNPDSIFEALTVGDQVGSSMTVESLSSNEPKSITFAGDIVLSGTIVKHEETFKFHINDLSKSKLPYTNNQKGLLYLNFQNIDEIQEILQTAYSEESYIKFIISKYHYSSQNDKVTRSIHVTTVIHNGEYIEITPQ